MSIYVIKGGDLCYIGSTTQSINTRFNKHKNHYKCWKNGKGRFCSSFEIFDMVGMENCKIELLEKAETLKDRERFHIQNTVCVNRNIPNRGKKEYYQDTRPRQLEYKNKKFVCECGGKYTQAHKARHFKSKLHLTLCPPVESQNIPEIPS